MKTFFGECKFDFSKPVIQFQEKRCPKCGYNVRIAINDNLIDYYAAYKKLEKQMQHFYSSINDLIKFCENTTGDNPHRAMIAKQFRNLIDRGEL